MEIRKAITVFINVLMDRDYVYSDKNITFVNGNRQFIGDSLQSITDVTNEYIIQANLIDEANKLIKIP